MVGSISPIEEVVLETLKEYGINGFYISSTTSYNPATSTTTQSTTNIPVRMLQMDLTLQSNGFGTKYGTEIQEGDKEIWVQPPQILGGTFPVVNISSDRINFGGTIYKIVSFKKVDPTGSKPYLFVFYCRL